MWGIVKLVKNKGVFSDCWKKGNESISKVLRDIYFVGTMYERYAMIKYLLFCPHVVVKDTEAAGLS